MRRRRSGKLIALALLLSLAGASPAQELSKEFVYVGGRLLTVDIAAATGDPDLWIQSLTADGDGPAGGSVQVSYTIRNSGGATGASTAVGFYFSTDSTITTGDTASTTTVPLNSPYSGPSSGFVNVQIPSGLTPGSYYLGAIVDASGSVSESNEANNIVLADTGGAPGSFTILTGTGTVPIIDSLTPTSGSGGSQLFTAVFDDAEGPGTLRDLTLLIGSSASTGCYVKYDHLVGKFYLRDISDTVWTELIEDQTVSNSRCTLDSYLTTADEDTDLTVSWNLSFKSPFASGTAKNTTLYARDAAGLDTSSTEGTWTVAIPNLSFSTSLPDYYLAGSGIVDVDAPVSVRIISDGPEVADVQVQFHRTGTGDDEPPDPLTSATRVGTCYVTVPAETSIECLDSVTLTATGSYKIWAVLMDSANANEGAALDVGDISISNPGGSGNPDLGLTPTSVYPRTLPVGGYGFMNFMVLNHEFVSYPVSHSSTVGVYLSTDPLVTTSDHLLATCSVGSFSTWFSEACSYLFFDPNETNLGTNQDYYVKAIADIYNNVSESNESNQASTSGHVLHYGGDFEGTTIRPTITSLPAEASLGETISYSLKAQNIAPSNVAALGPFYGDIYISETGYLDVGWKQLLGSCTSWSENTKVEFFDGQPWETTCSGTVDIPSSVQGSDHFIVVDFRFANQEDDSLLPGGHAHRKAIDLVLPPAVESGAPSSGSGRSQIFTLTYSDRNGADDISSVKWISSRSLVGEDSCYILYYPGTNALYLLDDAAVSWGSPITPGSGSLSNSTCSIDGSGVVETSAGDELQLTLPVTFVYPLGSNRFQWMTASDSGSQSTGWVSAGTWTIPGVETQNPTTVSFSPSSGGGMEQAFTLRLADADGAVDLSSARVQFSSSLDVAPMCQVLYIKSIDSIRFLGDAGGWSSAVALGASTVLENSQCRVDASNSSSSTSGTYVDLTLDIEFLPAFEGEKNVYGIAFDRSGYASGWQTLGTWEVPEPPAFLEVGGLLVVEAESGGVVAGTMSKDWQSETSVGGYSGSAYLRALPDTGAQQNTGYIGVSPEIRIPVQFNTTGTYYVWVRAYMGSTAENTIHAGLDGAAVSTADRIESTTYNSWVWTNSTMDSVRASMNVSSAGLHNINLWMREDGFRIDKVLLTTNASYTPTGTGPAESPDTGDVVVASTGGGSEGYADPNWTLSGGTAYVTIDGQFPFGPWLANTVDSGWISPHASYASSSNYDAPGTYTYSTTFDLGGHNPSTASITFVVAVDDSLTDVKINGTSTGLTASGLGSFSSPMTIDSGFITGTNTLEFVTSNGGTSNNPTGLRVKFQY